MYTTRDPWFQMDMEVVATTRRKKMHPNGKYSQEMIYKDAMTPFAKVLRWRIRDKRQNVVVVTGRTGSGKSTVAINLALAMNPNWSLEDNYIYSVGDLKRKLANYKTSDPISLFDEGSVSLNSANGVKRDDKEMVVLFDTMRSLGWTTIICIPDINNLNRRVKENHVDFMVICPNKAPLRGYDQRGFVEVYEHRFRDWGQPYWQYLFTSVSRDLKPSVREQYEEIKKAHQMEIISKFIESEEK